MRWLQKERTKKAAGERKCSVPVIHGIFWTRLCFIAGSGDCSLSLSTININGAESGRETSIKIGVRA